MMSRCGNRSFFPSNLEAIGNCTVGLKKDSGWKKAEIAWSGIMVGGTRQLQGVAILVHRPALLIDLATRQFAQLVADRTGGKGRIGGLVKLLHQSPPLEAVGFARQVARDFPPGSRRIVRMLGHYSSKIDWRG